MTEREKAVYDAEVAMYEQCTPLYPRSYKGKKYEIPAWKYAAYRVYQRQRDAIKKLSDEEQEKIAAESWKRRFKHPIVEGESKQLRVARYHRERRARRKEQGLPSRNTDALQRRAIYSSRLKKKYGITMDEFDAMLEEQNGCCMICGRHNTTQDNRFCVDHCHKSGKVRGLLCYPCNSGLGHFKDDIDMMFKAIAYLNEHMTV